MTDLPQPHDGTSIATGPSSEAAVGSTMEHRRPGRRATATP